MDEAALLFAGKVAEITSPQRGLRVKANARERRRAIEAALWLEARAAGPVRLEDAARERSVAVSVARVRSGAGPHRQLGDVRARSPALSRLNSLIGAEVGPFSVADAVTPDAFVPGCLLTEASVRASLEAIGAGVDVARVVDELPEARRSVAGSGRSTASTSVTSG